MVVAAPDSGDPIGDALRRLGRVRIATKYPRVAAAHFAETGRQAEIVEVKGSVELAPLTGLVDGIVDLTATGKTLAENNLKVVERDRDQHGPPDRQPRGPQAEGGRDRRDPGAAAAMRVERNARLHRIATAPASTSPRTSHAIIEEVARGRRRRRARA